MPLGGIGTGCICLNGYGGLQDFSVWNHPSSTALPEGFASSQAGFAILHIKGAPPITKLIEGPFPVLKIFDQGLQGSGYRRGGFEGFPRFEKCVFKGEYPFGEATITDSSLPLQISLSAWNPFIPLDDKNSGIPCAILEYTLQNSSGRAVEYEFSYHLSHLASGCGGDQSASRNTVIADRGVFLHNVEKPNAESFGSACLTAIDHKPRIKGMWLRSPGWEFDSLSALWREVSTGTFTSNGGSNEIDTKGRNGSSILLEGTLAPGESRTYPIVVTWHFPNCYLQVGGLPQPDAQELTAAILSRKGRRRDGGRSTPRFGTMPARSPFMSIRTTLPCERARSHSRKRCSLRRCRCMCWMRSPRIWLYLSLPLCFVWRMVTFGAGKDAFPMLDAAMVPARTCGTMPRRFLIFIRSWSGLCAN